MSAGQKTLLNLTLWCWGIALGGCVAATMFFITFGWFHWWGILLAYEVMFYGLYFAVGGLTEWLWEPLSSAQFQELVEKE